MKIPRTLFPSGKTIFREGEAPGNVYLVKRGKVRLVKNHGKDEVILEEIGENGVFGEMSLIDQTSRSATALAIDDTECYVLNRQEFDSHLKDMDPFMRGVFRIIVSRLRDTTAQLTALKNK